MRFLGSGVALAAAISRFSRQPFADLVSCCHSTRTIWRPIASTTMGTTAFPNCRYACVSETTMGRESGKPMSRAHSRGVRRRGLRPSSGTRISDPSLK